MTIAFSVLAVASGMALPPPDSTLIAEVARHATGGGFLFTAFQASSSLLLLSAAASSYLAGSGVLKALATIGRDGEGLVPSRFEQINRFLIPEWGVALVLVAAAMLVAAGGREQRLVGFYAVAVFASFLAATIACARLSYLDGRRVALVLNCVGAVLVAIVLGINATRLDGLIALLASAGVAIYLWRIWVLRGRPRGVRPPLSSRGDSDRRRPAYVTSTEASRTTVTAAVAEPAAGGGEDSATGWVRWLRERGPDNCWAAHLARRGRSILELWRGSTGSLRLKRMAWILFVISEAAARASSSWCKPASSFLPTSGSTSTQRTGSSPAGAGTPTSPLRLTLGERRRAARLAAGISSHWLSSPAATRDHRPRACPASE